jgi:hypothetical protein
METREKGVILPVDLFNKLFEFLQDQSYRSVGSFIEEIRQSAQVVEIPSPPEEEENSDD